jgi:hypothetical protein
MKTTSVRLSDSDLARLVDSADPDVAEAARLARQRLDAVESIPGIQPHVAQLVIDVVEEARKEGLLTYQSVAATRCAYCGRAGEWKKSKRRRKEYQVTFTGRDFGVRFIRIQGHISVGGCAECVDAALPHIRARLAVVRADVPDELAAPGRPRWRLHRKMQCTDCGWTGHEGEMGWLPCLFGDDRYPGECPSCRAQNKPLGRKVIEVRPGHVVAEVTP